MGAFGSHINGPRGGDSASWKLPKDHQERWLVSARVIRQTRNSYRGAHALKVAAATTSDNIGHPERGHSIRGNSLLPLSPLPYPPVEYTYRE